MNKDQENEIINNLELFVESLKVITEEFMKNQNPSSDKKEEVNFLKIK
jgi:hypothetical protein